MAATPASSKRRARSSAEQFGNLRPALHRHLAVARVEPDRDLAGKLFRRVLHQRRIAHRRGADDDAVDAFAEPGLDRRHVADAAAELHAQPDGFQNAVDRVAVHRLAGKGAVEIDHVQVLEALHFEFARLRRRIAMENGRARHVALLQPHGEAFLEVDGGEQDHGFHRKKFAISFKPSFWLFSGWNCVPTILSRPTMAVSGPP